MTANAPSEEELNIRLFELRLEHRDLDQAIERISEGPYVDGLQLQRMKRRKLQLKDRIAHLEDLLIPDDSA